MSDVAKFPLSWPAGWPRANLGGNLRTRFSSGRGAISVAAARDRLNMELRRLGASRDMILSSNLRLGARGEPLGNQPEPADRGVAVYFNLKGKDRVLACDRWTTVAGNIAAIAAHIGAMRAMDRYGVGTLDQAFAGYDALPPPGAENRPPWRKVLGLEGQITVTRADISSAYREAARELHPDAPTGNHDGMAQLNEARDTALREIG